MTDACTTLLLWPEIASAQRVSRLGDGPVSDSWLIRLHDDLLVLRIDRPTAALLGLDRHAEAEIARLAAVNGLGPNVLFSDPDKGVLVTRFLSESPWDSGKTADFQRLKILGRLLSRVHKVSGPCVKEFEPGRIARRYAGSVADDSALVRIKEIDSLANELYSSRDSLTLCHHDPHFGNVLGSRPALLIDWEYAAWGNHLFDIAAVVQFHALGPAQRQCLTESCTGTFDQALSEQLELFERLYQHLSILWTAAVNRAAHHRAQ